MAWFDDLELPGSTVTGHFGFVHEDGPDEDDYPDIRLASGRVRFEPTATAVKAGGAWIGIAPVEAELFEGELVTSEEDLRPPRILSTDADTGVENWGWKATFDIRGASIKPITFKAPESGVHLTSGDLIPITGLPVEVIAEGALGRLDDLEAEVAGKAPLSHTHTTDDVDGLTAVLPTVDTSVGTRVYIGEHLVYADTGWRDMRDRLNFPATAALLRRINGQVYWVFQGVDSGNASNSPLVSGFTGIGPSTVGTARVHRDDLAIRIGFYGTLFIYPNSPLQDTSVATSFTYPVRDDWLTSLPGDPA